jgi:hypothetical protein
MLAVFAVFAALTTASAQTYVYVDPSQTWIGYMNVFDLPSNGGGYEFGSAWATADLDATFSGSVLTFTPNTSIDRDAPNDPYWWNPDGSPNKYMDANFYVQNDSLAGQTVVFSGYCWTNSLVPPYSTNTTAFIKDFVSDYSSFTTVTSNLYGGFFSISLATSSGDHIQYGFEMIGPDARITNLVNLGAVVIASNPPPPGPIITLPPSSTSVLLGSNVTLSVTASGGSLVYLWQENGVNLSNGSGVSGANTATLTLTGVTGSAEGNYTVIVSNFTGKATAMARLTVVDPNHLTLDPTAPWIGYMNVFDLSMDWLWGSAWGLADLQASFNNAVLTLSPNTNCYDPSNPYWVNPDGSGAKNMDALIYQQFDQLGGLTVTFVGYCPANTLASNYTSTAFIRDFNSSYALVASTNVALVTGQAYSIAMATTAGDHIQWGFETIGPDANPTNVASLGNAQVSISPPTIAITRSGRVPSLTFPTERGLSYVIQYKTNLTDAVWQTLGTINGNGNGLSMSDASNPGRRFYRLCVQ